MVTWCVSVFSHILTAFCVTLTLTGTAAIASERTRALSANSRGVAVQCGWDERSGGCVPGCGPMTSHGISQPQCTRTCSRGGVPMQTRTTGRAAPTRESAAVSSLESLLHKTEAASCRPFVHSLVSTHRQPSPTPSNPAGTAGGGAWLHTNASTAAAVPNPVLSSLIPPRPPPKP
jgi:hypothetical protein